MRPSKIILWLDDEAALAGPPAGIARLMARGLQVRQSQNFGPHTKYFPYLAASEATMLPLVTADDDVIYPRYWLERLVEQHAEHPESVIAYRARRVSFDGAGRLRPYEEWPFSTVRGPSLANFGTGHSGVLYPPGMQDQLRQRGDGFLAVCRRADDIWLHNTAVRAGTGIRLVHDRSVAFDTLAKTQRSALKHSNVGAGANDEQINRTYSQADLQLIRDRVLAEDPV